MADAARALMFDIEWNVDNSTLLEANNAVDTLRSSADEMFNNSTNALRGLTTTASRLTRGMNNAGRSVDNADGSLGDLDDTLGDVSGGVDDLIDDIGDLGDTGGDVGDDLRRDLEDVDDLLDDVGDGAGDAGDDLRDMARQQEIEDLRRELDDLRAEIEDVGDESEESEEKVSRLSGVLGGMGKIALAGVGVAIGAITAVGAAAINAGAQQEEYFKIIAIGTGAVDDELDDLMQSFVNIGKASNRDLEVVAQTLTETNRALGYQGEELEAYSNQILNLGGAIEEDYAGFAQASGRAAQVWGLTAEEAVEGLDTMYAASRGTSIGMTEFSEILTEFGPSLELLGYNFTESAALIGNFERQGYSGQQMVDALKASVESMAGEGVTDFAGGMDEMVQTLKSFEDDADAAAWATENLGGEAVILADAIRNGALDISEFVAELEEAPGAIDKMAQETESFQDKLGRFKNNIFFALEPIGSELLDIFGEVLEAAMPLLDTVAEKIGSIFEVIGPILGNTLDLVLPLIDGIFTAFDLVFSLFDDIDLSGMFDGFSMEELFGDLDIESLISDITGSLRELFSVGANTFRSLLKVIRPIIGPLTEVAANIFPAIIDVMTVATEIIGQLADGFAPVVDNIMPLLADLINQAVDAFSTLFDAIAPIILEALPPLIDLFSEVANAILPPVIDLFSNLIDTVLPPMVTIIETILSVLQPLIGLFTDIVSTVLPPVIDIFNVLAAVFTDSVGAAIEDLKPLIDDIVDVMQGVIDFVKNVFTGNWEGAWQNVVDIFGSIFSGIQNLFKIPLNIIIRGINTFFEGVNKIKVPDWVPIAGGQGFNFTPIQELATGTESFSGGIALVGEQGPEIVSMPTGSGVLPNDRTERLFGDIAGQKQEEIQVTVEVKETQENIQERQRTISGINNSNSQIANQTIDKNGNTGQINPTGDTIYEINVGGVEITINADNIEESQMEQLRQEMQYEIPNSIEKAFKKIYLKNKPA